MRPLILKCCIRALATFIGLCGCVELWFSIILLLSSPIKSFGGFGMGFEIGFAAFSAALGSYLVYVGYLAWFRWSPLAVRHVVGTMAVSVFGCISHPLILAHPVAAGGVPPGFLPLLFVPAGYVLMYASYKWCVSYCNARLFPPVPSA